jgi:hypothetical protein
MAFELTLLFAYRLLALVVAVMMIWLILREKDWRNQLFAAMIVIPFALRAAGIK